MSWEGTAVKIIKQFKVVTYALIITVNLTNMFLFIYLLFSACSVIGPWYNMDIQEYDFQNNITDVLLVPGKWSSGCIFLYLLLVKQLKNYKQLKTINITYKQT